MRRNLCKLLIIISLCIQTGFVAETGEIELAGNLGIFQMIARAELLLHVRVNEGSLKYAKVEVQEAIKGTPPAQQLRIAYREHNWLRQAGTDAIVFPDGQDEILFLIRNPRRKVKEKNKDIFDLFQGRRGRMTLPAEGGGILLEALRRLSDLTQVDPVTQAEGLLALLRSTNPYLLDAALDEVARLRVASPVTFTDLVPLMRNVSPAVRVQALRIVRQVFKSGVVEQESKGVGPDQERTTLDAVMERARNDEDPDVRVSAVAAMAAWPVRSDIEEGLRAIASMDRSQHVRYEAERALFRMGLRQR